MNTAPRFYLQSDCVASVTNLRVHARSTGGKLAAYRAAASVASGGVSSVLPRDGPLPPQYLLNNPSNSLSTLCPW